MRDFITALSIALTSFFLAAPEASAQGAVYYSPVNTEMEIGIGFNPSDRTFTFGIADSSEERTSGSIEIFDKSGKKIYGRDADSVTLVPKDSRSSFRIYSCTLSAWDFASLARSMRNSTIVINGIQVTEKAFRTAIASVMMPTRPRFMRR